MSLTSALEKYPIQRNLNDGRPVEIRSLRPEDLESIKDFYPLVPEHERMFIKHPVTDMSILDEWCENIDYERNLPLLAVHENQVIGEGTLHCRNGGWKQHIGLVTVLTNPNYRGLGLSEMLVDALIEIARQIPLKRLEAEFNGERKIALKSFSEAGFETLIHLTDYLRDMNANPHDYVLMGMSLHPGAQSSGTH